MRLTFCRLGASLEGAYVIWDDLLTSIAREQRRFVLMLIKTLLEAITARPGEDAQREALCLWVTHVLHGEAWSSIITTPDKIVLRKDVMIWCCTHPGDWTQRLGRDVLKTEDEEFVEDWQELFDASSVDGAEQARAGGARPTASSPGVANDSFEPLEVKLYSDEDSELGTWVRAARPFAAPIGVVR